MQPRGIHSPQWIAIDAECTSAATQTALGAKALSRVTPERPGSFYAAFFPLSIGYERMGKIALHVDRHIKTGKFVPVGEMKGLSHNLVKLFDSVESAIGDRYESHSFSDRPNDAIHSTITSIISDFAQYGRYNHLDTLGGKTTPESPEALWDSEVVVPLAAEKVPASKLASIAHSATALGEVTKAFTVLRRRDVDGTLHTDLGQSAARGDLYIAVAPHVRVHTLAIGRWLARILTELGREAMKSGQIPYLSDYFSWLLLPDPMLKQRANPGREWI